MTTKISATIDRARLPKQIITGTLVTVYLGALAISLVFIYLAWDGGQVIQQVVRTQRVPVYSTQVYRAVSAHYFSEVAQPGWDPLSLFIGVSNVINLYFLAPTLMLLSAVFLSHRVNRWRKWVLLGVSLVVVGLLVGLTPQLSWLAVILD
jgi:drug/metabolite transporter (DMT)-like permease